MSARIGSLCTGYGGLDCAVQSVLGGELAWVADNDPGACKILAHRFPSVPNHGDITETDWAAVEPVDILTAGFPCQPVSAAGRRAGTGDERWLFDDICKAIGRMGSRPGLLVLENVPGLLSANGGDAMARVIHGLAALGYVGRYRLLRASDVGAPHKRERWFSVAWPAADARGDQPERGRGAGILASPAGGAEGPGRERERDGDTARGGRAAAADAAGHEPRRDGTEPGDARGEAGSRPRPVDRGTAQDAYSAAGSERREPAPGQAQGRRPRADAGRPGGARVAADRQSLAAGVGSKGLAVGEVEHHGPERPAAERGSRAPAADAKCDELARESQAGRRSVGRDAPARSPGIAWGAYEPAIRRWEAVLGRPAPRPTEPGRTGERLSPRFVEFLMGLPDGWVTDVPGLSRNQMLHALGNGVVPQQAATALRHLLGVPDALCA